MPQQIELTQIELTPQEAEKLREILSTQDIQSVSVVHMEVPCCFGTVQIVKEALRRSGREIPFLEHTVSIRGSVL